MAVTDPEILDGYHYEVELYENTLNYYNNIPLNLKFKVQCPYGYGLTLTVRLNYKGIQRIMTVPNYNYEDITVPVNELWEWTSTSGEMYIQIYEENSPLADAIVTIYEYLPSMSESVNYLIDELKTVLEEKSIPTNQNDGLLTLIHKVRQIPYTSFRETLEQLLDENQEPINLQSSTDLKSLIKGKREHLVENYMLNPSNYTFVEGNISNLTVTNGVINQTSRSVVTVEPPTDATKWVFTFKLQLTSSSRWFILFDKTTDSSYDNNYEYGMDIMSTGSPHCEFVGSNNRYNMPNTYSDTDFPRKPSGYDEYIFFDFTLIRYDNNYIITWQPYNETYYNIIIVPNTVGDSNLIGFWTWSSASFKIKDLEFYTL